ncbi:MAG TPA: RDD family protein [Pyrinomonadaceae bacterium]|nr:RDD family protein [Pyrinomonadaceae bacterium]
MEKYRTLAPRLGALILDLILLLPLAIFDELIKSAGFSPTVKFALFFIVALAEMIYYVVLHGLFGQTVGKMLMKVRVQDAATGSEIKFRQALLRDLPLILLIVGTFAFSYPVSPDEIDPNSPEYWKNPFTALIIVYGIVDLLSALTNDKRRALHDYIAGTVVVRTDLDSDAG